MPLFIYKGNIGVKVIIIIFIITFINAYIIYITINFESFNYKYNINKCKKYLVFYIF